MAYKLIGLLLSGIAFGQLRTTDFQQSLNAEAPRNYIKNSGIERNDANITDSSSIASRTTTTPLEGVGSLVIDATASGQKVVFLADDLQAGLLGQSCEAQFSYQGDASLYKAYVQLASTTVSAEQQLVNTGTSTQRIVLSFPCGASTTDDPSIHIEATDNAAASIEVDSVYLGKALNIGSAAQAEVLVQARRITSAQAIATNAQTVIIFNGSAFDPYSKLNTSTGVYTMPKNARVSVRVSSNQSSVQTTNSAQTLRVRKNGVTQLGCENNMVFVAANSSLHVNGCAFDALVGDTIDVTTASDSDTSYNVDTNTAMVIEAFPTPSEQVFRVGAPGLDWTAFTPTGGFTNTTYTGFYKCTDGNLSVRYQASLTGTPVGTLTLNLPAGFTIDTTRLTSELTANRFSSNGIIFDSPSQGYQAMLQYSSSTALVARVLNQVSTTFVDSANVTASSPHTFATGDFVVVNADNIPVTAASPCPRAPMPLLKNAVTTPAENVEKIVRARLTCGASSSINWQSGTWISTIGNVSSGTCAVTIATGTFSSANYACSFIREGSNAANLNTVEINGKSATGFNMLQINQASGTTGADAGPVEWDILCMGPS